MNWHTQSVAEVLHELSATEQGLSKSQAEQRLKEYGQNKLPEGKKEGLFSIFFNQFQSPLIYILLGATAVVFFLQEPLDGSFILAILLFNALVGTIQEGRAQNTLAALKKFSESSATVVRDGKELLIKDTEVVPGDILLLQEGEKIPADSRIMISNSLKIDESSLTGESESVSKVSEAMEGHHHSVIDQKNMVFKGTHVVAGSATAVVVATGLSTEIGQIAKEISSIDTEMPLKTNIRYLSRLVILVVVGISIFLIVVGTLSGKPLKEMVTTAVALSVSVIPEGLPIVITLVLATGVWRMSKHKALVKKLQAVEALGQTKIIAVDKTGTLTLNEMVIQKVYTGSQLFEVGGVGYEPKGELFLGGNIIDPLNHPELLLAGKIAAFSSNARISFVEENGSWKVAGDPTEAAMLCFAEKIGFKREVLDQESPRISELPFDYREKYHASLRNMEGKHMAVITGAPERILELCQSKWDKGVSQPLTKESLQEIESVFFALAHQGFRVVAFAMNQNVSEQILDSRSLPQFTFAGLFAMKDALRPEVKEAVENVREAHMRVVMITGDHKITAQAVAKEAGIWKEKDGVLTGQEIDDMSDTELSRALEYTLVFARVSPEHKLRIIQAYRSRGEVVAMTGDGVNDAPSLVAADLGVAMGKIGTEVAKEAADIVLLDDNFASIVSAAEEGRSIYKTIKKVILYLFSTSLGETLTIVGAVLLTFPLPILPAQIIWLNFVTDGFLDVALAMEPKEKGLLKEKFMKPKKWIVDGLMAQRMLFMSLPMAIGTLYLFSKYIETDPVKAWSISLTLLAVFQWLNAWNCRSENKSIFRMNPFSNRFLIGATCMVIFLQVAALYTPFLQSLLHTQPLELSEWITIVLIATSVIFVEELRKLLYRIRSFKNEISDFSKDT